MGLRKLFKFRLTCKCVSLSHSSAKFTGPDTLFFTNSFKLFDEITKLSENHLCDIVWAHRIIQPVCYIHKSMPEHFFPSYLCRVIILVFLKNIFYY